MLVISLSVEDRQVDPRGDKVISGHPDGAWTVFELERVLRVFLLLRLSCLSAILDRMVDDNGRA